MLLFFKLLVITVALEHLYFLILEMFLWTTPKGIKTFGLKTKTFAEETKVLAANQGLYNGFLAIGLCWSLYTEEIHVSKFFLLCIIVAGIYGAYSTKKLRLFYIQAIPAIFALITSFLI